MLGIENRVIEALQLPVSLQFSVTCVRTAEPKYLLFEKGGSYPRFVVQFGATERLKLYFETLSMLNSKIPGCVSRPIALHELNELSSMLIISGLPGMPWFNLGSRIKTNKQWLDLQERAFASLRQFQMAVSSTPSWRMKVIPKKLFEDMVHQYVNCVATVRDDFHTVVTESVALLDDVGEIDGFYQHGDFCTNNLMISDNSIGIIDLEHFGELTMPLHDEFLLVDSLVGNMPARQPLLIEELWNQAFQNSQYSDIVQNSQVSAFYLHHLLWWSIGTFSNPLRHAKHRQYEMAIDAFCANYIDGKNWHSNAIWNLPKSLH